MEPRCLVSPMNLVIGIYTTQLIVKNYGRIISYLFYRINRINEEERIPAALNDHVINLAFQIYNVPIMTDAKCNVLRTEYVICLFVIATSFNELMHL